ncbi:MAG: hypothetical protein R2766_10005 [Saprospiraceae bacterium]
MNKLTNKENKIKEILQSQSMPIDVNEVWSEVENQVRKPETAHASILAHDGNQFLDGWDSLESHFKL